MTTITKGSLVNGTYALMRISGLTVSASNEDIQAGLQVADDYAAELLAEGLDLGWQYPATYGYSDPSDISGLTVEMAGPFKKLLYIQLCSYFGKPAPAEVIKTSMDGMRTLENLLVNMPTAQNPSTLPQGSGNEWSGWWNDRFYAEPANNVGADYVIQNEILNYAHDFSGWLVDDVLATVTWASEGITITSDSFTDQVATAELTFSKAGGHYVTITATKSASTDKVIIKKNFVISDINERLLNA